MRLITMLGKIIAILAVSSFATGEDLSLESYTSDLKPSALDLRGFAVRIYSYTPLGWNYTEIDRSILEENLDRLDEMSKPLNTSARDYISLFPEHTLSTTEVLNNRALARELAQRVPEPDPNIIPCVINSPSQDDLVVTRLSCRARERYEFTVIGMLEKEPCVANIEGCRDDGFKIYSTTVVFGKDGEIIVKYRKFHLIDEPALDPAATQEEVTFTTESNVTFGLLTGHDMFFHSPTQTMLNKGIKYFIFNGAWKNKMPFQFSTSVQLGWTAVNKVFLAAGGYMRAELGYSGFGHYFPSGSYSIGVAQGSGGYIMSEITISDARKTNQEDAEKQNARTVITGGQDLREWSSVPVPYSNQPAEVQVCHEETEFCCTLSYRMIRSADQPNYQLIAFDGNTTDSEGTVLYPEQTCGLVACSGTDVSTCGADKNDVLYTNDLSFVDLKLQGSFSSNKVVPVSMVGNENHFPLSTSVFTIVSEKERYNVTFEFASGGFAVVHSFGLSSSDYRIFKSGVSKNIAAPLILVLLTAMNKFIS